MKFTKKGQLIIVYLMGAVALLAVIGIIFSIAQKFGDSDEVVKAVLAEEIRISINALISVPGDARIKLPMDADYDISKLTSSLYQGFVEVYSDDDDSEVLTARKVYHLPNGYDAIGTVKESLEICLVKEAKIIRLEECD
jgi:hypothetical protein